MIQQQQARKTKNKNKKNNTISHNNNSYSYYPNTETHKIIINTILKSNIQNTHNEIEKIINTIYNLCKENNKNNDNDKMNIIKPDIEFYNYIMKACSLSPGN